MRFNYNGVQYQLGFMYPEKHKYQHPTKCVASLKIVVNKDDPKENLIISQAESNCNPSDNYNYETGRKIALNRMLKNENLKETPLLKKAVFVAYNSRKLYGKTIPTLKVEKKSEEQSDIFIFEN